MAEATVVSDGRADVDRAAAELAERLPAPLEPLAAIAFNYRWSWLSGGALVFRSLDAALWRRSHRNPRGLIEALPPHRLRELAAQPAYLERVAAVHARIQADLARPPHEGPIDPARPVAYFCSEFGVHPSLPLYGGGLGVLAGDLLKAASDLALPMVGVGLLYREGYFHQRLDLSGWQHEYWQAMPFERTPTVLVTDGQGRPLRVGIELRGRAVQIQIWRVDIGRVPLYLLDTDCAENHPIDRWITSRLYIGDRHTRLAQYAVLGVGGVRALAALGVRPGLVHLNEGHAALSGLERLRAFMAAGRSLPEALEAVRRQTVFTTHTPVGAGNEWYSAEEIEPVLGAYADSLGPARPAFYDLGRQHPDNPAGPVAITPLALRLSRAANGVSKRHGEVARGMWQGLFPGRAPDEVPIGHVTNGVHTTTWMAGPMQDLLDAHLGADWRDHVTEPALWARLAEVPDAALWQVRRALRGALVSFVRVQSIRDRLGRGEAPAYVESAAHTFDPEVLTIGFARRVATYKRLYLLTRQLDRALRLLGDWSRPVQLVIAGKAHPQDEEAKHTLRSVLSVRHTGAVASRIVFLEDYDLHLATRLVSGVDLWLNLPRPPLEASGTSGMKVVLNGALNLSVLDGWWEEADDGEVGWSIRTPPGDPQAQDDHDGAALFDLLEREVIPLFYERDGDGLPRRWIERMRLSMQRLIPRFSAERMLRDYVAQMYGG